MTVGPPAAGTAAVSASAVAVARPRRWDSPFGDMSDEMVDRILATPNFSSIDPAQFPSTLSLRDIIRNDARIVSFRRGDIIVREGDYGGSVFLVLEGELAVLFDIEATQGALGRRRESTKMSWVESLARQWRNPKVPEVRKSARFESDADVELRGTDAGQARTFFRDPDTILANHKTITLEVGTLAGEIAALSRSTRTATIFAKTDAEVLELRWQGLRDVRRRDSEFREYIDGLYRSRDLTHRLRDVPLFAGLSEETLALIAKDAVLEAHGEFEWQGEFKAQRARDSSKVIDSEPLIAEERHYLDGLLVIRTGFARISRRLDHGHQTVGYLTTNEVFGLEEIVAHWREGKPLTLANSLRAVGYTDVIRIPTSLLEEHVLPGLDEATIRESASAEKATESLAGVVDQTLLDALVDERVINGSAAMLINTDRCVSCDACVEACAVAHDNNPRFVRHGESHAQVMFANACMHCNDPVCLIGCPTGAIHRSVSGPVLIDDPTCIGCSTCADACPYHNIRMVEIRDASGAIMVDDTTGKPIAKATKCDLCIAQPSGPACANACPHDALVRVDLRDRAKVSEWLSRSRRIRDSVWRAVVTFAAIGVFAALHELLTDSLRDASYFSGWTLLSCVVLLGLFGIRKRLPTLPLLDATRWARVHGWLGVFALGIFVMHTGLRLPGGWVEGALALSFLIVSLSGLGGRLMDRWIPRRMRTHGELILFDRIEGFRWTLAARALELSTASVSETGSSSIADFYARRLARYFSGPRNVVAHWFESSTSLEALRLEMRHLSRYLDDRGKEILGEIGECVEAKDNLDYQWAQQIALRSWRAAHRPVTWAVVILMLVHLVLVYAFSGS